MQKEAERDSDDEAKEHEDDILAGYIGAGLALVEAHDLKRGDLSYTLGDVDVVEVEQHDEGQSGSACDDENDYVIHTLHGLGEALSGIVRGRPRLDGVVVRQVRCDLV